VAVVRAHRGKTVAFVLADTGTCLDIQRDKVARVRGRALRAIASSDLGRLRLPASWAMAVVLCPGDTTDALAAWASKLDHADVERISFYEHPDVDPALAYRGWSGAWLPMPNRDVVKDFASLHRRFGNDLNDRTYQDAKARR
jgi:hypothetical protein